MPDPLFDTRTPRHDLPLLFAGQSQKEGYVNEIASRIDALLFLAVEGQSTTPPAAPVDGTGWLIEANPIGEWADRAGCIASRQAGNWLFSEPVDGMRLLNKANGQEIRFHGEWRIATKPAAPIGGNNIDSQARAAIDGIMAALTTAGIIPAS